MARTLTSTLTSALNATNRRPQVTLTAEDHTLHSIPYQAPASADAWHDATVATDHSIVRCQITRGGFASNAQVQRVTDPQQPTQWTAWTTLPGGSANVFQDGGCCISNNGGTLKVFAQQGTGGNALWNWVSNDNGATWTGPGVVLSPPGSALTKGIGSAGNNDVFFIYDISGGEAVGCSFYTTSWSTLRTWTLPTIGGGAGIAAVWDGSTKYTLIYSDGYSLKSATYTPGTTTWAASSTIAAATSTIIIRTSPRVAFYDGVYSLVCIEQDSGLITGSVYSYPRIRQSADLLHWSNGRIAHDLSATYGAALLKTAPQTGSAGTQYYLITMAAVQASALYATANATQYLDLSASILAYTRQEAPEKAAKFEVLLDNNTGAYNALIGTGSNYQPIMANATLVLSEGYKTGTPPSFTEVVVTGRYRINQVQIERSPEQNQLRVVAYDLSRNLDTENRFQMTYTGQTVSWLIAEVCARAGLFSPSLPATSQMSQVIPTFVLHAGQTYRLALGELANTYGLEYFLDQTETLQFRELASGDAPVWSYQPEIEIVVFGTDDERGNHIIVSGKPPIGGQALSLTVAEAYDDANAHRVGLERLIHHADTKLTTVAQCASKAAFLLAQEQRSETAHAVTVPLNPALQLLDVLTLTDSAAPRGSGQSGTARIIQSHATYHAQHAIFEMQLHLEGV